MSIPQAVEGLIGDARLSAHLATSVEDRPHVAPVWYICEEGTLSVLTGGTKLRNVRRNLRVAFSIESSDVDGVDWTVHLLGTARIVEDEDRVRDIQERIDAKYDGPYGTDGGEIEEEWGLVRVEIGSVSWNEY